MIMLFIQLFLSIWYVKTTIFGKAEEFPKILKSWQHKQISIVHTAARYTK